MGWGLYAPDSKIRVRMLSWDPAPLPTHWLEARIAAALERRAAMGLLPETDGYREINSEGDGLPGLVVDRYGDQRVAQVTTAAIYERRAAIADALAALDPRPLRFVFPAKAAAREGFAAGHEDHGAPFADRLRWREHQIPLTAPAPPTQKTGAYHDQRENRARVAELVAADGRPLLDLGTHVGGFSLHAAARGIDCVAVDQSETMLAHVRDNAAALRAQSPGSGRIEAVAADIFAPLREAAFDRRFGCVVFDPPKVVQSPRDLPRARKAMGLALREISTRLDTDGLLVVCSCSHHLDGAALDALVADVHPGLRPFERRGAGADHPIAPGHTRGEYLRVHLYRV